MVHEVRNRVNTGDWTDGPEAAEDMILTLEISTAERLIDDRLYKGIVYQYRYKSGTLPIYKIVDRATWEIGGGAVGNEFWMRNCFVPPLVKFESTDQAYSTEWYIPDCSNPSAFQFLPLQTELQGFTFTAAPAGVLATFPTQVSHVRSLFEKQGVRTRSRTGTSTAATWRMNSRPPR